MKISIVIQARLNSHRLPRKVLMPVDGRPLLSHVIERAKQIRDVDPWVIVAVPRPDMPDITEALWQSHSRLGSGRMRNVVVYAPVAHEDDVLHRYVLAARFAAADAVVRITADCPLLSPEVASLVVERFRRGDVDYASNVGVENGWPDGWDTEVVNVDALEYMDRTLTDPRWREHVTNFLRESAHSFRVANVKSPVDRSREKWSVDSIADLARVRDFLEREAA